MRALCIFLGLCCAVMVAAWDPVPAEAQCNQACTRYAGPAGAGTNCTLGDPCTIQQMIADSAPGDNNCLLDGTYQGVTQRIYFRATDGHPSGTDGNPITFCAVNPGEVILDGQADREAVWIRGDTDYITIEGIDATGGQAAGEIIRISDDGCVGGNYIENCRPDFITVRNTVCYDYAAGRNAQNNSCISADTGEGHLFEDVACGGIHRKCMSPTFRTLQAVQRRVLIDFWGTDWDTGPIFGTTTGYHGYESLTENVVCHWTNRSMDGALIPGTCIGNDTNDNGDDNPYAPPDRNFGHVENVTIGTARTNNRVFSSLIFTDDTYFDDTASQNPAYGIRQGDPGSLGSTPDRLSWNLNEIHYTVSYLSPEVPNTSIPIGTRRHDGTEADDNTADNNVAIGGTGALDIHADWTSTNNNAYANIGAFLAAEANWYTDRRHCFRTVDGVYTALPLWPYPIAARLQAAQVRAGVTDYDMNTVLWGIFGTPPDACRNLNVASCEIGAVDASTLVTNWTNDVHPPLSAADNAQFAVEYDATPQTENTTVIVGDNQTRTAMAAAATAGQVITMTPAAAAVSDNFGLDSHAQAAVTCTNNVAGVSYSISQVAYRWNAQDDAVDGTTYIKQSKRGVNTDIEVPAGSRPVYTVAFETTAAGNVMAQGYRLQRSDSKTGTFTNLANQGTCGSGTHSCAVAHPFTGNATSVVIDPDAGLADVACQLTDAGAGIPNLTLNASEQTECRYAIQIADDAPNGTVECFRVVADDGTAFNGGYGADGANIGCVTVVAPIAGIGY